MLRHNLCSLHLTLRSLKVASRLLSLFSNQVSGSGFQPSPKLPSATFLSAIGWIGIEGKGFEI